MCEKDIKWKVNVKRSVVNHFFSYFFWLFVATYQKVGGTGVVCTFIYEVIGWLETFSKKQRLGTFLVREKCLRAGLHNCCLFTKPVSPNSLSKMYTPMVYFWTYAHPSYCPSDLLARGFTAARLTSGRSARPLSMS